MQNGGVAQHSQSHTSLSAQAQTQTQTQTQTQAQAQAQAQSSSPQPPQSPQSFAREKARVSVLLEINSYLLQEVVSLQAQGRAGGPPVSLSHQSPLKSWGWVASVCHRSLKSVEQQSNRSIKTYWSQAAKSGICRMHAPTSSQPRLSRRNRRCEEKSCWICPDRTSYRRSSTPLVRGERALQEA